MKLTHPVDVGAADRWRPPRRGAEAVSSRLLPAVSQSHVHLSHMAGVFRANTFCRPSRPKHRVLAYEVVLCLDPS